MKTNFLSITPRDILPTPAKKNQLLTFCLGILIGLSIAKLLFSSDSFKTSPPPHIGVHLSHDTLKHAAGPDVDIGDHGDHELPHKHENHSLRQQLYDEVKVLCWIMTSPENHLKKAKHVVNTWGKRCNKLLVMSSSKDEQLEVVALPVQEGRDNLWAKTKEAFKYIYEHHLDDADWFMKADDDTYVIVENLRYLLYPYPPDFPVYFGHRFKPYVEDGYMSGGAGYVLSKAAVKKFVEEALPKKDLCLEGPEGAEDLEMGKCLHNVNVSIGDSRDSEQRGRFFPFQVETHLIPGSLPPDMWFWDYEFYEPKVGLDCCSDNAISFHYESPNLMYVMDYLIYHLRPYGIVPHAPPLPEKMTRDEVKRLLGKAVKPWDKNWNKTEEKV